MNLKIHKSQRNDLIISIAALPLYAAGIGWYGWKLGAMLLMAIIVGFITEEISRRLRKDDLRYYPFYLWFLYPLVFPPAFPLIPAAVAIIFSQIVCVTFFGGHGRQIVSPVAICWGFSILSFSNLFSNSYVFPFGTFGTGFSRWTAGVPTVDNPAVLFPDRMEDFLEAVISGRFPQPSGSPFPLLVIALGITLILLRAVDFRICLSFLATYGIGAAILLQIPQVNITVVDLFIGNLWFTAFFLLPDMRTLSRTFMGRWIAGILAGLCALIIRYFSSYIDGIIFAVILTNIFTGILDVFVLKHQEPKPV